MYFTIGFYEDSPGDFRREVRAERGEAHIIASNGSGFAMYHLERGDVWREGSEELIGVYDTREEAQVEWNRL